MPTFFVFLGAIALVIALFSIVGYGQEHWFHPTKAECAAVEGHWIMGWGQYSNNECWSSDGTRRLFP